MNYTWSSSKLFLPFRMINLVGSLSEKANLTPLLDTTPEALMDAACKRTGLFDYGDESFEEVLRIVLRSSQNDRSMALYEKRVFHSRLLIHLKNRLRIQRDLTRFPDILCEHIDKPIFIVGLQRTGTTFLQKLLARDPENRILRDWESNPAPCRSGKDRRIRHAGLKHGMFRFLAPHISIIHPGSARGALECLPLLMNSFVFNTVPGFCELGEYVDFARAQDKTGAYTYYKLQLQLLQHRRLRKRWVLKAPMHLENLAFLSKVFPDARFIQIHRSPYESIPSGCSLYATYLNMFRDVPDPSELGQDYVEMWAHALSEGLAARRRIPGHRFADVDYHELVGNPVRTVKGIYKAFHMDASPAFEQGMRQFLAVKRPEKHRYSLEQFQIPPKVIKERFGEYMDRFDISV